MFFKRAKKTEPSDQAAAAAPVEMKTDGPKKLVPLEADKLRRDTVASRLGFKSTADLDGVAIPFDAKRVQDALKLALPGDGPRKHVYVAAPDNTGAVRAVAAFVATLPNAVDGAAPDWIALKRSSTEQQFSPLAVTAGQGKRYCEGVRAVIARMRAVLPYLLEGEDIRIRLASLQAGFDAIRDDAFARLRLAAEAQNVAILTTSMGFAVAPMHEGKVVKPEVLNRLPEAMRNDVRRKVEAIEIELQALLAEVPAEASSRVSERDELVADYIRPVLAEAFSGLAKEFSVETPAGEALSDIQTEIIRLACRDAASLATMPDFVGDALIANDPAVKAALTIVENVTGDALAAQLIRAGKGIVVIDAAAVEQTAGGWAALKAVLQDRAITHRAFSEAIPVRATAVLVGGSHQAALCDADPVFARLVPVRTAFAPDAARSDETEAALARTMASVLADRGQMPFNAAAIALLIGESARSAGRPDRLSAEIGEILEIGTAANRIAGLAGRTSVGEGDIEAALAERRAGPKVQALFSTQTSAEIGRVLALGLSETPVEVWATVRPGQGRVGDIVSAAVTDVASSNAAAALWSYVAARYVPSAPLALAAALVHEPPTGVSLQRTAAAELYALLSALAEAPINASFAVAGWVSPSGALLPVPAINAAIEAAFDHVAPRDAAHALYIVIPRSNEADLMLRSDVVEAVRKGRLQIYQASTAEEGLALLTGLPVGERTAEGVYPDMSINRRIEDRLLKFARSPAAEPAGAPVATRSGKAAA